MTVVRCGSYGPGMAENGSYAKSWAGDVAAYACVDSPYRSAAGAPESKYETADVASCGADDPGVMTARSALSGVGDECDPWSPVVAMSTDAAK